MRKSISILVVAVVAAVGVSAWFVAARPSVPDDDAVAAAVATLERAEAQHAESGDVVAALRIVGRRKDGPTFSDMRLVAEQAFLTPAEDPAARAAVELLAAAPYAGSVGAIAVWSDCTSGPVREPLAKSGRDRAEVWLRGTAAQHDKDVRRAYFAFIAREEDAARRRPVENVLFSRIFVR